MRMKILQNLLETEQPIQGDAGANARKLATWASLVFGPDMIRVITDQRPPFDTGVVGRIGRGVFWFCRGNQAVFCHIANVKAHVSLLELGGLTATSAVSVFDGYLTVSEQSPLRPGYDAEKFKVLLNGAMTLF